MAPLMPRNTGRSIPAGAGETKWKECKCFMIKVDPRGCGGDWNKNFEEVHTAGRSPRVRGRPSGPDADSRIVRSIPAGAGETITMPAIYYRDVVDPRGCGGDLQDHRAA